MTNKFNKFFLLENDIDYSKKGFFSNEYTLKISPNRIKGRYCFVYAGQGSSFPGMCKDWFKYSVIRSTYYEADELSRRNGLSKISDHVLQPDKIDKKVFHIVQNLSLFTLEVALSRWLFQRNIRARAITGHSFGECAALVWSGIVSFNDMFEIVILREKASPPPNHLGYMIAINGDKTKIKTLFHNEKDYYFSNCNSLSQTVISVTSQRLPFYSEILKKSGVKFKVLDIPQPYHSPLLKDVCEKIKSELKKVELRPPSIPIFSSVLKKWLIKENFSESDFYSIIVNQIVEKVDFIKQINETSQSGCSKYIEIGPKILLSSFIKENVLGKHVEISFVGEFFKKNLKKEKTVSNSLTLSLVNKIISKLTGYKIDSISIEDRLQEDLGIDSLKKTEIVFSVLNELKIDTKKTLNLPLIESVGDIVKYVESSPKEENKSEKKVEFKRFEWVMEEKPLLVFDKIKDKPQILSLKSLKPIKNNLSNTFIVYSDYNSFNDYRDVINASVSFISFFKKFFENNTSFIRLALVSDKNSSKAFTKGAVSFFKSLKKELKNFYFKHIHFENFLNSDELVLNELAEPSGDDVVYKNNSRYVLKLCETNAISDSFSISDESTIVALGCARGIGFELLNEICLRSHSTIYVCGRSSSLEVNENISLLKKSNPNVFYISMDATNEADFKNFCEKIKNRIDIWINAVGIEISKHLCEKSLEEINKELRPKIISSILCEKFFNDCNSKRLIYFSSVVSDFGNDGQSVYAFSNGFIDGFTEEINKNYGKKIAFSIDWPPWDGVGMTANQSISASLRLRGLSLLDKRKAKELFIKDFWLKKDSILYFDESDIDQYSFGLKDFNFLGDFLPKPKSLFPKLIFEREFSYLKENFLSDHMIGSLCYVPAAMILSIFYGLNYFLKGEWCKITNFKAEEPLPIKESGLVSEVIVDGESMILQANMGRFHCVTTKYVYKEYGPFDMSGVKPFNREVYSLLFHKGSFRVLKEVCFSPGFSRGFASLNLKNVSHPWLKLMYVIDGAFQLTALGEFCKNSRFALPVGSDSIEINMDLLLKSDAFKISFKIDPSNKIQVLILNIEGKYIGYLNGVHIANVESKVNTLLP